MRFFIVRCLTASIVFFVYTLTNSSAAQSVMADPARKSTPASKIVCAVAEKDTQPLETVAFASAIKAALKDFDVPSGSITPPSGDHPGKRSDAGTGDHPSAAIFLAAVDTFNQAVVGFVKDHPGSAPTVSVPVVCGANGPPDDDCDTEYRRLAFFLTSLVDGDGGPSSNVKLSPADRPPGFLSIENGLNCLTDTYFNTKSSSLLPSAQKLALASYSLIGIITARDTHEQLQNINALNLYLQTR